MSDDSEDELPPNWQVAKTANGEIFYINHHLEKTQWEHPITHQVKFVSKELPFGWNQTVDENGKHMFVDIVNNKTTHIDPRLAFLKDSETKDSAASYGHQSNALQILYGMSLTEKTAIVTGANTGIGFEIARSLAKHGCQVILACRYRTKGEAACQKIRQEKSDANVSCRELNLCSLRSVKQFTELYRQECLPLHLLVLNAAVLNVELRLTEDNFEEMFQVNYLSQTALTIGLIPSMLMTKTHLPTRVVAISCESHRIECPGVSLHNGIILEHLTPRSSKHFDHLISYGQSKLCLIMFIAQIREIYPQIYSVSCHPGNLIYTDLTRNSYFYRLLSFMARPFSKSMQQAAATPIFCSIMKCILSQSTIYYNNCFECPPSVLVYETKLVRDLWLQTQTMIELSLKKRPLIV